MTWLNRCYTCDCRFFANSDKTAKKIWYWAEPGAATMKKYSLFNSQHFMDRNLPQDKWRYPGELPGFVFNEGENPHGSAGHAGCQVGKDEWFAVGAPANLIGQPVVRPPCCGDWPPTPPPSTVSVYLADQMLIGNGSPLAFANPSRLVVPGAICGLCGPNGTMFVPTAPSGCVTIKNGIIPGSTWWYLVLYWPPDGPTSAHLTCPPGVAFGYGAQYQDIAFGVYGGADSGAANTGACFVPAQEPDNTGNSIYAVLLSDAFFDQTRVPPGLSPLTTFTGFDFKASQAQMHAAPYAPQGPWVWPVAPPANVVAVTCCIS